MGARSFFGRLERASLRTVDEAAAALDRAPNANLLLVADLPTGASLAFELAVSFARQGRETPVGILSILPALITGSPTQSVVTVAPPDRLVLRRDDGFLHSYVERALAGPRTSFAKGETFERDGYTVTVLEAPDGQLRAFETRVADPAHTLVLRETETGLVPLALGPDAPATGAPCPPRGHRPRRMPGRERSVSDVHPAVDAKNLAGHVGGLVAREVDASGGHLRSRSGPPQGDALAASLLSAPP